MGDWSDQIIGDLKREGKYDEMRRNIADELTLEGIIPNLQVSISLYNLHLEITSKVRTFKVSFDLLKHMCRIYLNF